MSCRLRLVRRPVCKSLPTVTLWPRSRENRPGKITGKSSSWNRSRTARRKSRPCRRVDRGSRCRRCAATQSQRALGDQSRTYQRGTQDEAVLGGHRPGAQRPDPANKLSPEEREDILKITNSPVSRGLPPSQIESAIADVEATWPRSPPSTAYCAQRISSITPDAISDVWGYITGGNLLRYHPTGFDQE